MKKSQIFLLISALSNKQRKDFRAALKNSCLVSKPSDREMMLMLWDALIVFYNDPPKSDQKQNEFLKKAFVSRPQTSNKARIWLAELKNVIEKFLSKNQIENHATFEDVLLLRSLNDLEFNSSLSTHAWKRTLKRFTTRAASVEGLHMRSLAVEEWIKLKGKSIPRQSVPEIHDLHDQFMDYVICKHFKIECSILNHNQIFAEAIPLSQPISDFYWNLLRSSPAQFSELTHLYSYAYRILESDEGSIYFEEFFSRVNINRSRIEYGELHDLITCIMNYCTKRIKEGYIEFNFKIESLFDSYVQLILDANTFSSTHFLNYLKIILRNNRPEKAKRKYQELKKFLLGESNRIYIQLAALLIEFYDIYQISRKSYPKPLTDIMTQRVSRLESRLKYMVRNLTNYNRNHFVNLEARAYLQKLKYIQEESTFSQNWKELFASRDTPNELHRQMYMNFDLLILKLAGIAFDSCEEGEKFQRFLNLKDEIQSIGTVASLNWLLKEIEFQLESIKI